MNDPLTDADDESSTPLTPDERAALIPSYVTLRSEPGGRSLDRSAWRPALQLGPGHLVAISDLRKRYVEALRAADGEVIGPLLAFVRS